MKWKFGAVEAKRSPLCSNFNRNPVPFKKLEHNSDRKPKHST
ncbi:hypothetical protein [Paenibacillus odorifer]|nr:hypothetical protein [Paenibacillus odorifer]